MKANYLVRSGIIFFTPISGEKTPKNIMVIGMSFLKRTDLVPKNEVQGFNRPFLKNCFWFRGYREFKGKGSGYQDYSCFS